MSVSLCVPVLNNYTGLYDLIESAEKISSIVPDRYLIFNNGKLELIDELLKRFTDIRSKITIFQTRDRINLGVAASWNYLIEAASPEIFVSNDDIILMRDTFEKMIALPDPLVSCGGVTGLNMFSFFLIRKECIEKVGLFDESISPRYAYFEDNDYAYRMKLAGINPALADCTVLHNHGGSNTLKQMTPTEIGLHHYRFNLARMNYVKKWGGMPNNEIYTKPYGRK